MSAFLSPTKGNLINLKKSLALSKLGFELMDKKKNILIREMMPLVEVAKSIRNEIEKTFQKAYTALAKANLTLGFNISLTNSMQIENGVDLKYKNVMGIEIPKIDLKSTIKSRNYGLLNTNSNLDCAYFHFLEAKKISLILAELENSIFLLADEIKETKIRANALENIVIPKIEDNIKYIKEFFRRKRA